MGLAETARTTLLVINVHFRKAHHRTFTTHKLYVSLLEYRF